MFFNNESNLKRVESILELNNIDWEVTHRIYYVTVNGFLTNAQRDGIEKLNATCVYDASSNTTDVCVKRIVPYNVNDVLNVLIAVGVVCIVVLLKLYMDIKNRSNGTNI